MPKALKWVSGDRLRHLEAVANAARAAKHKSLKLIWALSALDRHRNAWCKKPDNCQARGADLCRSCNANRAALGTATRKKLDQLVPEQRKLVAESIKNDLDKTYYDIAEDWLISKSTVVKIAGEYGVHRGEHKGRKAVFHHRAKARRLQALNSSTT